jgi:hypothetical protein
MRMTDAKPESQAQKLLALSDVKEFEFPRFPFLKEPLRET